MIDPVFNSSDKTQLTNYSGVKKKWLVYRSFGNINSIIRSKYSNLASIVSAVGPGPLKYHFRGHRKTTGMREQQIHYQKVVRKVFEHICHTHDQHFDSPKIMLCADGQIQQCYTVICAWTADYSKIIHLHLIKQPHCLVWEPQKSSFADRNSSWWRWRDIPLYFERR